MEVHARVATLTDSAPFLSNTLVHSAAVAPLVLTSSISSILLPSRFFVTLNAPFTLAIRSCLDNTIWSLVLRLSLSTGSHSLEASLASRAANRADWLYLRQNKLNFPMGTGTMSSLAFIKSAAVLYISPAKNPVQSMRSAYLYPKTKSLPAPLNKNTAFASSHGGGSFWHLRHMVSTLLGSLALTKGMEQSLQQGGLMKIMRLQQFSSSRVPDVASFISTPHTGQVMGNNKSSNELNIGAIINTITLYLCLIIRHS